MIRRLFRPETVFFLLTWLGLMVAFRDRGFYDPGALWHVKVGDIILDRYTWGNAERVSPEAPVLVLNSDIHEVRLGGAASVAG